MYAASGMRNTIAIATVIVQAVAIRAAASPRPSLGASSCARKAKNWVRSMCLTRAAAAVEHAGQQERSGERQHVPSDTRTSAAGLGIEHIHAAILCEVAGADEPPFGGGAGSRSAGTPPAEGRR